MPNAFKKLVEGMRQNRAGVLPSAQAFPPIDENQLARQLRLDDRGAEDGRANEPPTDSAAPSLAELDIRAALETAARKAHEEYLSQLDVYDARIRLAVTSGEELVKIEAAGQNAIADYDAAITGDRNHLHALSKEVEDREQEFRGFKARHGLSRYPKTASARARVLHYMVLAIILLVESLINGFAFARGSSAGIIGGVVQAFVLSLLNVASAFAYAKTGLPWLFHRQSRLKVVGGLLTLGYFGWLGILNLWIGHFRDLYATSGEQVSLVDIANRLSTAPFILGDASSLILVLLGILFGLTSVADVAAMTDRYPGFSAVGEARQNVLARYAAEKEHALNVLRDLRNDAVESMTDVVELMAARRHDVTLATQGRQRLHQNYVAYLDSLAAVLERLVRRYRDANRRARTTLSPTFFRIAAPKLAALYPPALPPLPELQGDEHEEAVARIQRYIELVNARFREAIPEYDTPLQLRALDIADHVSV